MTAELGFYLLGAALVAYVLTAGADFGGGVWELFARGPRADEQRRAISRAIAPIWEANHIWLIFLVVVLFTVFPVAFRVVSVALHIPLTLVLVGIVLRGAAFVFRSYGLESPTWRGAWGHVFAASSALTPVFLGVSLAALSSGEIRFDGRLVTSGFLAGWTTAFAWAVGAMTMAICALLAAAYLTVETDGDLRGDFRRRAVSAQLAAPMLGLIALALAPQSFRDGLLTGSARLLLVGAGLGAALTLYGALRDRPHLARAGAAGQAALVVGGWGLAMDHHLVRPDVSLASAGTVPAVLVPLGPVLLVGAALLVPSLWYLYRVFKLTSPPR